MSSQIESDKVGLWRVRALHGHSDCAGTKGCEARRRIVRERHAGSILSLGEADVGQRPAAALGVCAYDEADDYEAAVGRLSKRKVLHDVRRAERRGYRFAPFEPRQRVEEIERINKSKPVRSGGRMKPAYQRTAGEILEELNTDDTAAPGTCALHFDHWVGAFKGSVAREVSGTNAQDGEELYAYLRIRRFGDYVVYGQVLGDQMALPDGVMNFLHVSLVRDVLSADEGEWAGVQCIVYGTWASGGAGLQRWKGRVGFAPAYLVVADEHPG